MRKPGRGRGGSLNKTSLYKWFASLKRNRKPVDSQVIIQIHLAGQSPRHAPKCRKFRQLHVPNSVSDNRPLNPETSVDTTSYLTDNQTFISA